MSARAPQPATRNARPTQSTLSGPLRVGIIGAGLMGRWHAHAAQRAGAQIVAIADPNDTAASHLAARYRGAQTFPLAESMLEVVKVEALHICTPRQTHYRLAELALAEEAHALIEKPLTPGAAETESLLARAAECGLILCPVHQFPWQDGVLRAQAALPRIGRLTHLHALFCSAGGAGQAPEQWDEIADDILPHPLSLAQAFVPSILSTAQWDVTRPAPGELRATGQADSVTLSLFLSLSVRPTACALQLFGTEGTIHLDLFHGYCVIESGQVSRLRKALHPFDLATRTLLSASVNLSRRAWRWQPAYPGLERLVSQFYRAIREGGAGPIPPAQTLAIARTRDLLITQARTTPHAAAS